MNSSQFHKQIIQNLESLPQIQPRCKHFGVCGGCKMQNFSYENQLAAKLASLKSLFSPLLTPQQLASYEIVGSPLDYEYRVKMEYIFSAGKFGLRQLGNPDNVIDLTECHLIRQSTFNLVRQVYEKAVRLELTTAKNSLVYLVIKDFHLGDTNQMILNIVSINSSEEPGFIELANYAISLGFASVAWQYQEHEQLAYGPTIQQWGATEIVMPIRNRQYLFNTASFSQNNLTGFNLILDYIEPEVKDAKNVLDLYCGIGTIGLQYTDKWQRLIGVEEVANSIELANRNAKLNGITNAEFFNEKVANFLHRPEFVKYSYYKQSEPLSRYKTENVHFDTIIVDPARAGLERKVTRRLQKYFDAEKIVYISCNPVTQLTDLQDLSEKYEIKSIKAFDLFPQTYHMENVVVLEKRQN